MKSISTNQKPVNLRRSYLYVPASSDRMLEKSITTGADMVIYDLEDSVSPVLSNKANARGRLKKFLGVRTTFMVTFKLEGGSGSEIFHQDQQQRLESINVAVRVNDITTPYFHDDILQIVKD